MRLHAQSRGKFASCAQAFQEADCLSAALIGLSVLARSHQRPCPGSKVLTLLADIAELVPNARRFTACLGSFPLLIKKRPLLCKRFEEQRSFFCSQGLHVPQSASELLGCLTMGTKSSSLPGRRR